MSDTTTQQDHTLHLAKLAVFRVLKAIQDDPAKYWLLGEGTESWATLTRAAAEINGRPVAEIKQRFTPAFSRLDAYTTKFNRERDLLRYCEDQGIAVPQS